MTQRLNRRRRRTRLDPAAEPRSDAVFCRPSWFGRDLPTARRSTTCRTCWPKPRDAVASDLADREFDLPHPRPSTGKTLTPPLLGFAATKVTRSSPPTLQIAGNPSVYLLYVSASPALRDTDTVVSKIEAPGDLEAAGRRSLRSFAGMVDSFDQPSPRGAVLTLAVRSVGDEGQLSPLSNSVDVLLNDKPG